MRTFSLLKGLPVYNLKNGAKVGDVCDLCITDSGLVKGLLIKKGIFLKQTFFLAIDKVASFGWDGIMVNGLDQLEKPKTITDYTFTHKHSLSGKMLMTKSGETLGLLNDVYFQEEMGTIVGYEVTDGFFSDITEGRQLIESELPPAIGKDAIIVDVNKT